MHTPVIVAAARTPLGSFQGGLKSIAAPLLGGIAIHGLFRGLSLPPSEIDEVIMGNVLSAGLGQNPARQAAVAAGIPFSVPSLTINMVCGSGLRSVCMAAESVKSGNARAVIAGGLENMSLAPQLILRDRAQTKPLSSMRHDGLRCAFKDQPMGTVAEHLARNYRIDRIEQDEYALKSHARAVASIDEGLFVSEIMPVPRRSEKGDDIIETDECPKRDCTLEKLSLLKPAFEKDGTITAGNATPIADGAAAVLVMDENHAREKNAPPIARIKSWCVVAVPPMETFAALIPAIKKIAAASNLSIGDIDVFEIGDSFAVEGIACMRELDIEDDKVNLRGGTLAMGHPLGASGCRILVTLLHILGVEKKCLGLAVICLGGGIAVAILVERIA